MRNNDHLKMPRIPQLGTTENLTVSTVGTNVLDRFTMFVALDNKTFMYLHKKKCKNK